jgi:hypothetical protein
MIAKIMFGIGMLLCGWTQLANAQTQPNPPQQICVNNNCVAVNPPSAAAAHGSIKWNPGHYMASYSVLYGGSTISRVQSEMDDLNNQDAIIGYRAYITWAALEPTKGNYDFSVLDAVLARLKTGFNKPKRLVIYLWMYYQGAMGSNDTRILPMYVQTDPAYGASPVAGRYGWWGKNSNGASTGQYAVAAYYPPVMDRLVALVQALGKHYDSNPSVEAIEFMENSTIVQSAAHLGSVDPHYSDSVYLAQTQRLLSAATAAFPHTSVAMDNSYFVNSSFGVTLTQWLAANRMALGAPDTWGQTGLDQYGTDKQNDGLETYLGSSQFGGKDLRSKMPLMMAIESPELQGPYFAKYGGPWTPTDMINALNQTYQASHAFWQHMTGSDVPDAAQWSNLAAACAQHPLTHTAYPANYP